MKSVVKFGVILVLVFQVAFSYSNEMINKCNSGYTQDCVALKFEADSNKDAKNAKIYESKLVSILDKACSSDYSSCLMLSNMYDNKDERQNRLLLYAINSLESKSVAYKDGLKNLLLKAQKSSDEAKANAYKERAVPLLESACFNDEDISACLILSYYNEKGIGTAVNTPKAKRVFMLSLELASQNCMLGLNDSCFLLDKYPNFLQNIESNLDNLKQECEKNNATACYEIAYFYTQDYFTSPNNTSDLSKDEWQKKYDAWDKIDFVKSAMYLQKACDISPKKCENSIYLIPNAKSCLADKKSLCVKVQSNNPIFLSLACDSGDLNSCYNMRDLPIYQQPKRQIKYLQKLCKGGVIESCNDLYAIYANGKGVEKDMQKALRYAQRACNWSIKTKGFGETCEAAGNAYENDKDIKKAIEAYKYSCDNVKDSGNACQSVAMLFKINKDSKKSLEYHKKACEKEATSLKSCLEMANIYANGESGEAQDINKVISIYNKILQNGDSIIKKEAYINLVNLYSNEYIYRNTLDYASILQQYKSACENGIDVCNVIFNFTAQKIDDSIINKDIVTECRLGNYNECYALANVLNILDTQKNVKINRAEVSALIGRSLDSNTMASFSSSAINSDFDYTNAAKILYIYSCKHEIKDACQIVLNSKLLESNMSLESKMALQKNICLLLSDSNKNGLEDICESYANYAFSNKDYENTLLALKNYKYTNDSNILNLIIASNYYLKNYKEVLRFYKYIYKKALPDDYYYLAKMYENGAESVSIVKNYDKAYKIYMLSTTPRSYFGAGQMMELGLGFYKDKGKARDFYALSCKLDSNNIDLNACIKLYEYNKSVNNIESARKYLQKGCQNAPKEMGLTSYVNSFEICKNRI